MRNRGGFIADLWILLCQCWSRAHVEASGWGALGLLSLGNWHSSRTSSSNSVLGRVTASAAGESR